MRISLKILFAVFLLLAGAGEVAYRVSYNAMAESVVDPKNWT